MKKWVGPGPMEAVLAESDVRVGGAYRIHMRNPNGTEHRAHGVYRVVDPPKKVVYTWTWETMPDVVDTVVTVEFHDRGGATEVVLRHDGLTPDQKKPHEDGWIGCFTKFATVIGEA